MSRKPTLLIILDGFGIAPKSEYNAISQASTPILDNWLAHRPHAILEASGNAVGLPNGYIGNSEVGHLTIGAGGVIEQPASFILREINSGSFFTNQILQAKLKELKKNKLPLHIIGLLSDGGVHCHEKVIHAFITAAAQAGIERIFVHPILDGRDVAPRSAAVYLQRLEELLKTVPQARIGSFHGRFYAMDRDCNWDRTQKSFTVLTTAKDEKKTWRDVLEKNYFAGITDEFIPPTDLDPEAIITNGDGVIFANYRPDRARQLTECFIPKNSSTPPPFVLMLRQAQQSGAPFLALCRSKPVLSLSKGSKDIQLNFFLTPVSFGTKLDTDVMYPREHVQNTFKEILSHAGKTIFSIAETEKYPHITYFFDGGRETIFPGETRVHIPSIKAHNYISNPQMSAPEITHTVITSLRTDPADFYLINYANADMVGHSGNFEATKKAIEILDKQLGELYEVAVKEMHGTLFITADHGNAEHLSDEKGGHPLTAHTSNPVPFIMINDDIKNGAVKLPLNELADVKSFILKFMGVER